VERAANGVEAGGEVTDREREPDMWDLYVDVSEKPL